MLGIVVPDTFGALTQLTALGYGSGLGVAAATVALAGILALTFVRRTARHNAIAAPVGSSSPRHRHHYHRAAPYVRHKDLLHPGRPSPRAPDC